MIFLHPLLLAGLALVSVPIIIHLIMRQEPKRLIFPAFRFLKEQFVTNQRKLRLRHWLLLAVRMLLIALMCLALARPRLYSDRLAGLAGDQAAIVVLVIDTSPTMEYTVADKSRLDDAKARALELLDELGPASRVALIDTAEGAGEWLPSLSAARERIASLDFRAANLPVTTAIESAERLLAQLEPDATGEVAPRLVYVISDRTPNSWDNSRLGDLKAARDRLPDPKPNWVFLDVGIDKPSDVAVSDIQMRPQVVPANKPVVIRAVVQSTGQPVDTELLCRFDSDLAPERKPIRLSGAGGQVVEFERRGLAPGMHQAEISLVTTDSLPGNNGRYVTFEVRQPRKVLIVTDDRRDAEIWRKAVDFQGLYQCDVKATTDAGFGALGPSDFAAYKAVFLLSVSRPGQAGRDLWDKLEPYVRGGGGLGILPGGEDLDRDDYNKPNSAAQRLMPGTLVKLDASADGLKWGEIDLGHPLLAPFRAWAEQPEVERFLQNRRRAFLFWDVQPEAKALVLARYDEPDKRPALLERIPSGATGRGRVLLFTTPMDERQDALGNKANDYNSASSFFFVLANLATTYLAGEIEDANFNYLAGSPVVIPLPPNRQFPTYVLQGPGITGADTQVTRPAEATELRLTQPRQAGQYTLTGPNREPVAAFSVNIPPPETRLVERIRVEDIEELFGPNSVVTLGQNRPLKDAIEGQMRKPVDLFPWLMILLLFALAVENLLANRFYRQPAGDSAQSPATE